MASVKKVKKVKSAIRSAAAKLAFQKQKDKLMRSLKITAGMTAAAILAEILFHVYTNKQRMKRINEYLALSPDERYRFRV